MEIKVFVDYTTPNNNEIPRGFACQMLLSQGSLGA